MSPDLAQGRYGCIKDLHASQVRRSVTRRASIAGFRVCGFLLLLPLFCMAQSSSSPQSTPPSSQTPVQRDEQTTGIPKFYANSRQVLIEVEVWRRADKKEWADPWWVPKAAKVWLTESDRELAPALGLTSKDFHIFDNNVEQRINYFNPLDFPAVDWTGHWSFQPDTRGTWGWVADKVDSAIEYREAIYLIGYVPPTGHPGECRSIRVVVDGHDHVFANRRHYCMKEGAAELASDVPDTATLDARMRSFADSRKHGFPLSMQAFAFWSSGVLSLAGEGSSGNVSSKAATDFTYVVDVHDSKAPATVQIAAEFPEFGWPHFWHPPFGKTKPVLRVLGRVYNSNGEFLREFGDTYFWPSWWQYPALLIPIRFDTQIELPAGDYDLRLVVSDGQLFAGAEVPLHIERLDPSRLMLSNVVIGGVVRYAGWVLREAAYATPAPIVPSPLVSKDSQYFPDSEKVTRLRKHTPLYFYFEIYQPQNSQGEIAVFYRWRITDERTGSLMLNGDRLSAAEWVVPGTLVIPIGLKLDTEKLKKGRYKLEVQVSDSAGRESEWRSAKFNIQ